jgi:hypothetical protein
MRVCRQRIPVKERRKDEKRRGLRKTDVVEEFEFGPAIDATHIASPGAMARCTRCTDDVVLVPH